MKPVCDLTQPFCGSASKPRLDDRSCRLKAVSLFFLPPGDYNDKAVDKQNRVQL